MKDKAVLAPTRHIFSSLAIDPSTSKNTLSCLFAVVTSYLPGLCQSRSTASFPRAATPSQPCRPPSWFFGGAHPSVLCRVSDQLSFKSLPQGSLEKHSPKASFLSEFPWRNQTWFKHIMYLLVCLLGTCLPVCEAQTRLCFEWFLSRGRARTCHYLSVYLSLSVWHIHGSHKSKTNELLPAMSMKMKTGKLEWCTLNSH